MRYATRRRDTPRRPRRRRSREPAEALRRRNHLVADPRHRLGRLLRQRYGKKGEAVASDQLLLLAPEVPAEPTAPPPPPPEPTAPEPKPGGHGRRPLPAGPPRERIGHDVALESRARPGCGGARRPIGEDVRERLESVPAGPIVLEHVRPKYACKCRAAHVAIAERLPGPIEKGLPGPGLPAHVAVGKFDGTPVKVRDHVGKGIKTGRLWVYLGDPDNPFVVDDHTPDRSGDGPERAHAAIARIGRLYGVERDAKRRRLDDPARHVPRPERPRPAPEAFGTRPEGEAFEMPPESPAGAAAAYTRSDGKALSRHLETDYPSIGGNASEKAIRPIAVGRENRLSRGGDRGGRTAAAAMSRTSSCKASGVEPFAYLRDLPERAGAHPNGRIAELSPDRRGKAEAEAVAGRKGRRTAGPWAGVKTAENKGFGRVESAGVFGRGGPPPSAPGSTPAPPLTAGGRAASRRNTARRFSPMRRPAARSGPRILSADSRGAWMTSCLARSPATPRR